MNANVTNLVGLKGSIVGSPIYSHTFDDVAFYAAQVDVPRISGKSDRIHVFIPENLLVSKNVVVDDGAWINGLGKLVQSRSNKNGLQGVSVVFTQIDVIDPITNPEVETTNYLILEGIIIKTYPIRPTQLGERIRTVLVKNIDEKSNRSLLVPALSWNNCAEYVEKRFSEGDKIKFKGRLESRERSDKDNPQEIRLINEISILSILPSDG